MPWCHKSRNPLHIYRKAKTDSIRVGFLKISYFFLMMISRGHGVAGLQPKLSNG